MRLGMTEPAFELAGGQVVLAGSAVLDKLDFRVGAGEFVAVLGANGSGKTTLVRALVGLVPLAAGRLWVLGEAAAGGRGRSRIGYVPQRPAATGGIPATVREVVSAGRTPAARRLRGWSEADRCAIDCAIDTVGLSGLAGRPVAELSGGQQQRVFIARALAGDPAVLVLDEPTAGVDADSQRALAGALGQLKTQGVAVLLVAHELGPLEPLVDRVVILSGGKVVYDAASVPPGMHDATHHHMHHPSIEDQSPWGLS
jgi:zinc transport system ATP-binding protein